MNEEFDFRGLLLEIRDSLSEVDRRSLHFILGNDVPRSMRENTTLGGTLDVLESLFDRGKISSQCFDYLIVAFHKIPCPHAVLRLKEHKLKQRRSENNNVGSKMISDILYDNEDKISTICLSTEYEASHDSDKHGSTSSHAPIISSDEITLHSSIREENCSESVLIVREGLFFGEPLGGEPFDDALNNLLTINDKLLGVKATWSFDSLTTITFIYSNGATAIHGTGDATRPSILTNTIMLNPEENIIGVTIYKDMRKILNPYQPNGTTIVVGLQFYTNENRQSALFGSASSTRSDEVYPDYKLAFARGRSHGFIDALQFIWYKSRPCNVTTRVSDILK
ncbi:hypothetical protein I4U23_020712 [Adineta vaga]|nr:hypothetical protein I4U23_020712 [Adineta vaga]